MRRSSSPPRKRRRTRALRFWELPTPAVVLGAGGSVAIDVNVAACEADGVPILRRASGGGTVLLGPGCLCFSLVLSYDSAPGLDDIRASNRYVLQRIARALQPIAATQFEGTSDLAVDGVKGFRQRPTAEANTLLASRHTSVRIRPGAFGQYLNVPERQPDYRRDRPHAEFADQSLHNDRRCEECWPRNGRQQASTNPCPWSSPSDSWPRSTPAANGIDVDSLRVGGHRLLANPSRVRSIGQSDPSRRVGPVQRSHVPW